VSGTIEKLGFHGRALDPGSLLIGNQRVISSAKIPRTISRYELYTSKWLRQYHDLRGRLTARQPLPYRQYLRRKRERVRAGYQQLSIQVHFQLLCPRVDYEHLRVQQQLLPRRPRLQQHLFKPRLFQSCGKHQASMLQERRLEKQ
jgi:hypothetical protein